jgi:hypothetical protein
MPTEVLVCPEPLPPGQAAAGDCNIAGLFNEERIVARIAPLVGIAVAELTY